MSKVTQEKLLAGIIFGDNDNEEYIYLPGGEVGSEAPLCVLERAAAERTCLSKKRHSRFTVLLCAPALIRCGASAHTKS